LSSPGVLSFLIILPILLLASVVWGFLRRGKGWGRKEDEEGEEDEEEGEEETNHRQINNKNWTGAGGEVLVPVISPLHSTTSIQQELKGGTGSGGLPDGGEGGYAPNIYPNNTPISNPLSAALAQREGEVSRSRAGGSGSGIQQQQQEQQEQQQQLILQNPTDIRVFETAANLPNQTTSHWGRNHLSPTPSSTATPLTALRVSGRGGSNRPTTVSGLDLRSLGVGLDVLSMPISLTNPLFLSAQGAVPGMAAAAPTQGGGEGLSASTTTTTPQRKLIPVSFRQYSY